MDDKQKKELPEDGAELADEKLNEVSGGILIDWTPVDLEPVDP